MHSDYFGLYGYNSLPYQSEKPDDIVAPVLFHRDSRGDNMDMRHYADGGVK